MPGSDQHYKNVSGLHTQQADRSILRAMLVLHSKERPHATSQDFAEGHKERHQARMLGVVGIYGIEYPVETENRIYEYCSVVPPRIFESKCRAQERMLCIRVHQAYGSR